MKRDAARGELSEGGARYLLVRADSLMGTFRRLPRPARRVALAAFADSVAEHGGRSAERYGSEAGRKALLRRIEAAARELGWGAWKFDRRGASIRLSVRNSPFAAGYGPSAAPVCAPIVGMLRAVATRVLARPMSAQELECAAAGGGVCRFCARVEARKRGAAP